ncbi:alcohol dehydrogenase catalytic domain-containing protein [Gulosibacter chungangensis]|nr:alcohol dehydrogenase catalytic domain-containing protein [Gulosibacter chungangensis]
MKAIVANSGGGIGIIDVPESSIERGRVRIKVVYGGICGSDLHYAQSGKNGIYEITEPMVLGHEIVGIVEAVGSDIDDVSVGDHVAVHPGIPTPPPGGELGRGYHLAECGTYFGSASTSPHTPGGFSDYVTVNHSQIRMLPEGLSLRRAALAEPLSVALHGIHQAPSGITDAKVLVAGAGPIGSLVVIALRERGVEDITVTDIVPRAVETASRAGAKKIILLGSDGPPATESFDLIIESSGSTHSLISALDWVRRGGTIVQLGLLPSGDLKVPLASLVSKEVTLRGSQRFDVEMDEAISMLARNDCFDEIVSDVYPASQAEQAFSLAADSSRSSKVLLQFSDDPTE